MDSPTVRDPWGVAIVDPHDRSGRKYRYITLLHERALERYLPRPGTCSLAIDVGCGPGRLTAAIRRAGWRVLGIDPDLELLRSARGLDAAADFCRAALPHLPVRPEGAGLVLLMNVLRPLHITDRLELARGIGRYVAPGGHLMIMENIRPGHPRYIDEADLVGFARTEGCNLERSVAVRGGGWWVTRLIGLGWIPTAAFGPLAEHELGRWSRSAARPRRQYLNVLFTFLKQGRG